MTCLKRALKIANAAQQQLAVALKAADTGPVLLFVEILNQYLYYFEERLPSITTSVLQVRLLVVASSAGQLFVGIQHRLCSGWRAAIQHQLTALNLLLWLGRVTAQGPLCVRSP